MPVIRQAHMPGNYETYDLSSSERGHVVCKICWELAEKQTTDSLQTVWVSVGGWKMVWWVCRDHLNAMRARGAELTILRSTDGVISSPEI